MVITNNDKNSPDNTVLSFSSVSYVTWIKIFFISLWNNFMFSKLILWEPQKYGPKGKRLLLKQLAGTFIKKQSKIKYYKFKQKCYILETPLVFYS